MRKFAFQGYKAKTAGIGALLLSTALQMGLAGPGLAQSQMEETVVTATRTDRQVSQIPLAVSLIDSKDIQLGRQELGLDESLIRVPGLVMQNRYNFAQDLRISIRGFGSRANFGVRGIKVIADNIPITLPDGQSGTDDLDIGSMQRIEVIRGPAASLYGTASGGVINLITEEAPDDPFVETKLTVGDYGHRKYQLKTGAQCGQLNYLINASHMKMDGYRDHSGVEHRLVNTRFRYSFNDHSNLTAIVNAIDSPQADDAGGITLAEVAADRKQAQARNLSSNAGESFKQQRLGVVYNSNFADARELTLRAYSSWKDFQTFLPIGSHIPFVADDGVVEFDRRFVGGGARYTLVSKLWGKPNNLTMGLDVDQQRDNRQRFINDAGVKGALVFDQIEKADSLGLYFRNEFEITDTIAVSIGGRFDKLDLSIDDHYLENGDQSSQLAFDEFNPTVAVLWLAGDQMSLYANYATAFETPTFTELGSPAQELNVNLGGFSNVKAQKARSFELGARGQLFDRLYYDVAVYHMTVDDEVTNVINIGSRGFFENADTDRNGFEVQMQTKLRDELDLLVSYTYSDFTFDRFTSDAQVDGERLPGIPRHQFYAELAYKHASGFYAIWDALFVGKMYVDNRNATEVDEYWVSNLRFGGEFQLTHVTVSPFFGINNLFNKNYFSNVRINAFGGRAFEPAPERHVYGGLAIRF